ncbi:MULTISPECIES: pyrimidine 5'-nucleotidase [Aeromonas]|uniref:pyrimidine 5'-nucleotidase n=1 Tax=Aeromonas TaxID=642 RepID=UPI001115DB44|nr:MULTISPECIES: pyrimidine 5'-nucleotidase [Aeromonas]MCE9953561.1 pyrimidine 5'-nucleotidase [Aeromonas allosaccharophila]MEB8287759.1 pyrimidine 5'-nucleotidase [Aeromonas veronii]TNI84573.1 noncanonical pyrimidine nucleotidase, YjjG family [Aeromonas allosaccharophila]
MKQPSYDWVLFDLDETLLDFPVAEALARTLTIYGVEADDAAMAQYHTINHGLWQQYNDGEIDATALQQTRFALFAQQVDADPMAMNNTFLAQIVALSMPLEGVLDTLQQLRSKVRMGIITNGFSVPQRGRLGKLGWSEWFEPLVISDEIRVTKPDPAIFQHTLSLMGQPDPARVLMVGDNPKTDIAGAAAQGLATCWYNPERQAGDSGATHEIHHFSHLAGIVLGH